MEDPVVYDKAKWHYDGDFPKDLPKRQGFVHTGMFLGWLIDRDLVSDWMKEEWKAEIAEFKARRRTGTWVYEKSDGCLVDDMLNEEGNRFAKAYFEFEKGKYLNDYGDLLADGLDSLYPVKDTWKNYDLLKARIDQRYAAWKKKRKR